MGSLPRYDVRLEYASWLATPRRLRVRLGLPVAKVDFADMKGVSVRTLNRWEKLESFQDLVLQRKQELAGGGVNAAVAVGPPRAVSHRRGKEKFLPPEPVSLEDDPVFDVRLSPDEQRYQQVKDTLVQMAMDGNQSAIDLYMKHYGRPFVEAEQQSSAMFANLSDDDLVDAICRMLGVEAISGFLARSVVDV